MTMGPDVVLYRLVGDVAIITLNRAEKTTRSILRCGTCSKLTSRGPTPILKFARSRSSRRVGAFAPGQISGRS